MKGKNRHVLLLLDNASSYQAEKQLSNVRVHMLPPNTTEHLQPQDTGITRPFKAQINRLQNHPYVDRLDELLMLPAGVEKENIERSEEALFPVDIFVAMQWAWQAWEAVTSTTITNCWRHTGILDEDLYELVENMEKLCVGPPSLRRLLV